MKPELRFHSIVITITTVLIFLVWIGLTQVITAYPVVAVVLSGLVSLGTYRTLTLLLLVVLRNVRWVKRFILGSHYVEGTWVGFFVGHNGDIRYIVEVFEQDLSDIVICGKAFAEDGTYQGSWNADNASLDVKRRKLSYHYETDKFSNTFKNPGIASFDIERPAPHKPPVRLAGFSSDLFSPNKLKAFEEKLSDDTMTENSVALDEAHKVYEKYKQFI